MSKILIKLSSSLIAVMLLLTAMPFSAMADETVPVIDTVKVTGATIDFNAGDTPVFTAVSAEPDLYSTRLDTFERWMDVATGAYITSSEFYNGRIEAWGDTRLTEFEAGHTYSYSLSVQAVDLGSNDFACTFDENASISINSVNYSVPTENKRVEDFDGVNYHIFFNKVFTITIGSQADTPHTHNYTSNVTKAPTCAQTGVTTLTCAGCGDTKTEAIPKTTVHTPVVIPAVPATTASTGLTEGSKCAVCGTILVAQTVVDKLPAPTPTPVTSTTKVSVPKIALSSVKSKKSKQITVSWKKNTKVTGYEVQYSTDKKFKKSVKTATVKKNKTTSTTIIKLQGKKKYYVRIRAYKTVNGKKYYSSWSKAMTVTTKK